MARQILYIHLLIIAAIIIAISCKSSSKSIIVNDKSSQIENELSKVKDEKADIKTTYFYIGQHDVTGSGVLDNGSSAWVSNWVSYYGGIDSPKERNSFFPKDFIPDENPFYCALPYNDISRYGHKPEALDIVPWAKKLKRNNKDKFISYCKNRWVKIIYKDKICYVQWEDVGPFETDDFNYVFKNTKPKNKKNEEVGLDISPACFKYLGMKDNDFTDWQFVNFEDVPDGPWLDIITVSDPNWE